MKYIYFIIFDFDNSILLLDMLPVKIYANADVQKVQILKENKGKSGIYLWKNNINEKTYVGKSGNISERLINYYNYKYISNPRLKMLIYKAILKYGYSNFSLIILEYCEFKNCTEREQHYINLLKPEYNILRTAGSLLGYKHTKETLAKLSALNTREKNSFFGKTHTKEIKAKLSLYQKDKF
uniref:hypothetical protein n=1 Tax=Drechslerella dactyloides TaxID=74499 RepID=UPI0022FD5BE1|nr:hypothetical protein PNX16_mgp017 [Drechslerella dactyloides]WAN89834.1 hypothetical protein [Drechslerella dactyloides]